SNNVHATGSRARTLLRPSLVNFLNEWGRNPLYVSNHCRHLAGNCQSGVSRITTRSKQPFCTGSFGEGMMPPTPPPPPPDGIVAGGGGRKCGASFFWSIAG